MKKTERVANAISIASILYLFQLSATAANPYFLQNIDVKQVTSGGIPVALPPGWHCESVLASGYKSLNLPNGQGGRLKRHYGLDIVAPEGTPMFAGVAGRVMDIQNKYHYPRTKTDGKFVVVGFGMKDLKRDRPRYVRTFVHNKENKVRKGQVVYPGTQVATLGGTGVSAIIPRHLHLQEGRASKYRRKGKAQFSIGGYFPQWNRLTTVTKDPSTGKPVAYVNVWETLEDLKRSEYRTGRKVAWPFPCKRQSK